ncbi:tRNA (adenosine(37)-N6)-threonylcarbamoyltransferase complex ATPase subunit type 1 TsaE [Patulibacter sp.]|uniref:tRNA (adenosine(37)-N6)-threonylcarbamoyltransferase complex ATPase subunit type 1 TsaE n=1 Tax=Patulibacter sp. TaxID=1912859 RepID=UPI00271E4DE5|nr:tRNA (adenosine(37)-N6)-threonylcarbamoyltransferase complex ATPase subunit type 1 TsaE [Patulibacter sp.]MDO9410049.1 tRNA (adenosine(37)-N6)-threonylcarbamoyltransferase complex ATPase subunit type 1 TsaE [Patulibacter sp.]
MRPDDRGPESDRAAGRDDEAPRERAHTSSAADTEALGAGLAGRLRAGDVVLLRGDLGAGKTTLVRGAAAALGAAVRVTSPTFALAHRYDGDGVRVAHLDLYRLAGLGEDDEELIAEELDGDVVAFVEWPDVAAELVAGRVALEVTLAHAGGDGRDVDLVWRAER